MTDEPLQVQCARALGWTDVRWDEVQGAWGRNPARQGGVDKKGYGRIPRYGMDTPDGWACTGPLAQQFKFELEGAYEDRCEASWFTNAATGSIWEQAGGASYPEAIARLVVKLAEMGKLERVE